jgi:hypothetical protein
MTSIKIMSSSDSNIQVSLKQSNKELPYFPILQFYGADIDSQLGLVEIKPTADYYIKHSPLLDTVQFLTGKYRKQINGIRENLTEYLVSNDFDKISSMHNASYVDCFFLYLSSQLKRTVQFTHAVDFYETWLDIEDNFQINVKDDIEFLLEFDYFSENTDNIYTFNPNNVNEHYSFLPTNNSSRKHHKLPLKLSDSQNTIEFDVTELDNEIVDTTSVCPSDISLEFIDIANESSNITLSNRHVSNCDTESDTSSSYSESENSESESVKSESVKSDNSESDNSESVKSEKHYRDSSESESDKSESDNSESVKSESVKSESVKSESDNSESENSESVKSDSENSERSETTVSEEEGEEGEEEEEEGEEGEEEEEEEEGEEEEEEEEEADRIIYLKKFPTQYICMEKCDGTLDGLFESGEMDCENSASMIFQVMMILIMYQNVFQLTHNDLHTNNILYINTQEEFLYYQYKSVVYKVPTYGKIYKIIDFGRSIYTFQNQIFCSDSFFKDGDAYGQYNCEPFYDDSKPLILPNPSFDLCRLACSIYDFIFDVDYEIDFENMDAFQQIIYKWCLDDRGKNVLYKSNGKERYPHFKLYKMIARTVHNHSPENYLNDALFLDYHYSGIIPETVMNIQEAEN